MSDNNSNGLGGGGSISDSWVDLSGQLGTTTPPLIAATVTPRSPATPPFGGEHDYLRMLREAQRESNRSSNKVSPISSALMSLSSTPKRASPIHSPKSPPNSPNPELASHPLAEELRGVYINKVKDTNHVTHVTHTSNTGVTPSDIVWDWTSRPNIHPKEWRLPASTRSRKSSSNSSNSTSANAANAGNAATAANAANAVSAANTNKLSFRNAKVGKKSLFSKEVMYTLVITNILSLLLGTGIGLWLSKRGVEHSCGCCGELIEIAL